MEETSSLEKKEVDHHTMTIDQVMEFVFPIELEHPLSLGRLYAIALYGPLDESSQLRAGIRGSHIVTQWELDEMCMEFEREDILAIFIHENRPFHSLSSHEKEAVISQADARLKNGRGRGLMTQLTKQEVYGLLEGIQQPLDLTDTFKPTSGELELDVCGLPFEDFQRTILAYRERRIRQFKTVFPNLGAESKEPPSLGLSNNASRRRRGGGTKKRKGGLKGVPVSSSVAPSSMFLKDRGMRNADIAVQTNKLLSTHAYSICEFGDGNSTSLTQNVRLLREDPPRFLQSTKQRTKPLPVEKFDPNVSSLPLSLRKSKRMTQTMGNSSSKRRNKPSSQRAPWNSAAITAGTQIGSLVDGIPSSTSWKRKVTYT